MKGSSAVAVLHGKNCQSSRKLEELTKANSAVQYYSTVQHSERWPGAHLARHSGFDRLPARASG